MRRTSWAVAAVLLILAAAPACLRAPAAAAAPGTCEEPADGSEAAPILSPPRAAVVRGGGRLQFYSAPDSRCPIVGTFVVPGDELIAYAQTDDGWTSVVYMNPRTADPANGWVATARLEMRGTMGPRQ